MSPSAQAHFASIFFYYLINHRGSRPAPPVNLERIEEALGPERVVRLKAHGERFRNDVLDPFLRSASERDLLALWSKLLKEFGPIFSIVMETAAQIESLNVLQEKGADLFVFLDSMIEDCGYAELAQTFAASAQTVLAADRLKARHKDELLDLSKKDPAGFDRMARAMTQFALSEWLLMATLMDGAPRDRSHVSFVVIRAKQQSAVYLVEVERLVRGLVPHETR